MNVYTLEVFIISGPVDAKFVKKSPVMSRTLEIRGDQTLEELHEIIFKAFDRYDEHLYEFQFGGKEPQDPKARRYGLPVYQDEALDNFKLTGDVMQTTIDSLQWLWCINRLFEEVIPKPGLFSAISMLLVGETNQDFAENWL